MHEPAATPSPLTRDQVVFAYRMLLGREPESEDVIERMRHLPSADALARTFFGSQEFLRRNRDLDQPQLLHAPPISIDISSEHELELLAMVEDQWRALGKTEPFWSVLSFDRWRGGQGEAQRREFLASGATWVSRLTDAAARCGVALPTNGVCVDYGCGLGRLSLHLAGLFRRVAAFDISSSHLGLAQEMLTAERRTNIDFSLVTTTEPPASLSYDAWVTFIVLQHSPPPIIARILTNWLGRLNPGGIALFQVPTYFKGYRFDAADYLARKRLAEKGTPADPEVHCIPQAVLFDIIDRSGCKLLEIREDQAVGNRANMVSDQVFVEKRK